MEHPDAYKWHANEKWFDGYKGQKRLVIDEFRDSQMTCASLLKYLDVYKLKLEIKGSHTWAKWDEVFITSNINPEEWYRGVPEATRAALFRRFTTIIEMN